MRLPSERAIRRDSAGGWLLTLLGASDANRCGEAEAGEMTLAFGFSAPESVLVVLSREIATSQLNRTVHTEFSRFGFATGSRLGSFCISSEEEMHLVAAGREVAPRLVLLGDGSF
jgi:hypothetical protein